MVREHGLVAPVVQKCDTIALLPKDAIAPRRGAQFLGRVVVLTFPIVPKEN